MQTYARNDQLELAIPRDFLGGQHVFKLDYLVRLTNGLLLLHSALCQPRLRCERRAVVRPSPSCHVSHGRRARLPSFICNRSVSL